jgi:16S rRNA (cytidine1402-2'-O)-methyltransferase
LAVSGYPADEFVFVGFAPSKSLDRKRWLASLAQESRTVVFLETPHRIEKTLAEMAETFGDRPITVTRELTKLHEQVVRTTAHAATEAEIPHKGEFTVVLGPFESTPRPIEDVNDETLSSYFYQMTNYGTVSRRKAVAAAAKKFGLSTNEIYDRLERLKGARSSS